MYLKESITWCLAKNNFDMQKLIELLIGILFPMLFVSCVNSPEEEISAARNVMDSAIAEKVNLSNPIDYYYLQDSVYKVLEEIERKKSKLFPAKYDKETKQLRELISQIEDLIIRKRKAKYIIVNDVDVEMDSIRN